MRPVVEKASSSSPDRTPPLKWRSAIIDDVRRRLEDGELDSATALLETAHAMLDGDEPPAAKKRHDD